MKEALIDCDRSQIKAIAVSGQQHGLVVLDAGNKVIRAAKLWCDLESVKEAQELSELFKTTIVPSFTSRYRFPPAASSKNSFLNKDV